MPMPRIDQTISLGNILNLGALVVAVAVAWGVMTERGESTRKSIDTLDQSLMREADARRRAEAAIEARVRTLEAAQARADERFNSVLQVLGRIEARLERIENR